MLTLYSNIEWQLVQVVRYVFVGVALHQQFGHFVTALLGCDEQRCLLLHTRYTTGVTDRPEREGDGGTEKEGGR